MKKMHARKRKGWEAKERPGKLERHMRREARLWNRQQERGQLIYRAHEDPARYHD